MYDMGYALRYLAGYLWIVYGISCDISYSVFCGYFMGHWHYGINIHIESYRYGMQMDYSWLYAWIRIWMKGFEGIAWRMLRCLDHGMANYNSDGMMAFVRTQPCEETWQWKPSIDGFYPLKRTFIEDSNCHVWLPNGNGILT